MRRAVRMRLSRKTLRRAVVSVLLVAILNSFGMGWWWLQTQTTSMTTTSSSHRHVPHPINHLEENRQLHQVLMQRLQSRPESNRRLPPYNQTKIDAKVKMEEHRMDVETTHQTNKSKKIVPNITSSIQQNQTRIDETSGENRKPDQTQPQDAKQQIPSTDPPNSKSPPKSSNRSSLLNCSAHGGPYDLESVQEMVYWKDIPEDLLYTSKFPFNASEPRYLTFDTDLSGFNNQRMVFEINVLTAIVTGRILVLPRDRFVDHLRGQKRLGLDDFFRLPHIAAQMPQALRLMTIDEFIQREGTPDKLHIPTNFTGFYDRTRHRVHRTTAADGSTQYEVDINGTEYHDAFLLQQYSDKLMACNVAKLGKENCSHYTDWIDHRHVTANGYHEYYVDEYLRGHPKVFSPLWGTYNCVLTIPDPTPAANASRYKSWIDRVFSDHGSDNFYRIRKTFVGNPVPVNAPPHERLAEVYQLRNGLCAYETPMQAQTYYHQIDVPGTDTRLLGHWYDYLFFEDWKQDLWAKRFVRDKLRYSDALQCAAARIIAKLRELSQTVGADVRGNATPGRYHAMHIRRTDLTMVYKDFGVAKSAEEIFADFTTRFHIIPKDSVVYIATDERNKHFFDVFRENYRAVYFLDDFVDLLGPDFPKEYYGMIDQLVCTKSEHFIGTFYSTFTGYINRLRGYHAQQQAAHSDSNEASLIRQQGTQKSWFYAPPEHMEAYQRYEPIGANLFEMEYARAWRNIDYDVDPKLRALVDQDIAEHDKNVITNTNTTMSNEKKPLKMIK